MEENAKIDTFYPKTLAKGLTRSVYIVKILSNLKNAKEIVMRGFGVFEKGKVGWMEKPDYVCGPDDVICRPLALAPCSSDVHSAMEMEGDYLKNRILGHESIGQIIEVGSNVKDFKVGDKVVIPCTTPTWKNPDIQDGTHQDAGGLFTAINFSSYEDGTFADQIKVRSADMNLALLPKGVSVEQACMVVDMMTTGFYGSELAEVKFGDTVVVFVLVQQD